MILIGFDFSLNSPGLVIKNKDQYNWISYTNGLNLETKKFLIHSQLDQLDNFQSKKFDRKTSSNYSEDEIFKLENADELSLKIIGDMQYFVDNTDIHIGMEGYSYGSQGNSKIDIVTYSSIIRHYIHYYMICNQFQIISPSQVKKTAGKGNMNKVEMLDAFIQNTLQDPLLENDQFHNYIKNNRNKLVKELKNGLQIVKPIDDMIDAYFVCSTLTID